MTASKPRPAVDADDMHAIFSGIVAGLFAVAGCVLTTAFIFFIIFNGAGS